MQKVSALDIWQLNYLISYELYFQRYRRAYSKVSLDLGAVDKIISFSERIKVLDQKEVLTSRINRLRKWRDAHRGKNTIPQADVEIYYNRLDDLYSEVSDVLAGKFLFFPDENDFGLNQNGLTSFDEAVAADFSEAIRCFSCECYTGTVFHCARAIETAVRRLAKKERIALRSGMLTWQNITDRLNSHLNGLPAKTQRQAIRRKQLSVRLAHLSALRIAWRNPVMHPGEFYGRDEAFEIARNTSAFVNSLLD